MSEKKKITITNVKQFINGNISYYKDKLFGSPRYLKEQYHYRLEQCKNDCVPAEACKYCECPPMKKAWNVTSCNDGDRFPDLMDKPDWEDYKRRNNVDIETIMKNHGV